MIFFFRKVCALKNFLKPNKATARGRGLCCPLRRCLVSGGSGCLRVRSYGEERCRSAAAAPDNHDGGRRRQLHNW